MKCLGEFLACNKHHTSAICLIIMINNSSSIVVTVIVVLLLMLVVVRCPLLMNISVKKHESPGLAYDYVVPTSLNIRWLIMETHLNQDWRKPAEKGGQAVIVTITGTRSMLVGMWGRDWTILCSPWGSTGSWGKHGIHPWCPYFFTTSCRPGESRDFMLQTLFCAIWHVDALHFRLHYWILFFKLRLGFLLACFLSVFMSLANIPSSVSLPHQCLLFAQYLVPKWCIAPWLQKVN